MNVGDLIECKTTGDLGIILDVAPEGCILSSAYASSPLAESFCLIEWLTGELSSDRGWYPVRILKILSKKERPNDK